MKSLTSEKYNVLLFGNQVFGKIERLEVDYCNIELKSSTNEDYLSLKRLSNYDLVILDYKPFNGQQLKQDIFDKQISEALKVGTSFCFLHYDEPVVDINNANQTEQFLNEYLGFRRAISVGYPVYNKYHQPNIVVKKQEFNTFGERWGISRTTFNLLDEGIDYYDEIFLINNNLSGFSYKQDLGRIIFLPCQRDLTRLDDLEDCLKTLINSILNYLRKLESTIPKWANTPLFDSETSIFDELEKTKQKLKDLEMSLEPFQEVKSLPFLREGSMPLKRRFRNF
jgi:hypothetical protein